MATNGGASIYWKQSIKAACFVSAVAGVYFAGTLALDQYVNNRIARFINSNPDIIASAVKKNSVDRTQESDTHDKEVIAANMTRLHDGFPSPASAIINRNDIVIFSDYLCTYCKKADKALHGKMNMALGNRKIIYQELPILSDTSRQLAELAIVADLSGNYTGYRDAIMAKSHPTVDDGRKYLNSIGLTNYEIVEYLRKPIVAQRIANSKYLADKLGITGTPTIVIGDRIIRGWNEEDIRSSIS